MAELEAHLGKKLRVSAAQVLAVVSAISQAQPLVSELMAAVRRISYGYLIPGGQMPMTKTSATAANRFTGSSCNALSGDRSQSTPLRMVQAIS